MRISNRPSASVALPLKLISSNVVNEVIVGALITGVFGAVFGIDTVIDISLKLDKPPLSVAVSLITWLPALNEAENVSPLPIVPSKFDVQANEAPDNAPSSGSEALPLKLILSVVKYCAASKGAEMTGVLGA